MNELHLFAGAGGGILGGILLGHRTVCAVEINPYCRKVLLQRQRDGMLPRFPIWDDVSSFDGKPWRGYVDAICGGFPCQDISTANPNAVGISGSKSGLWKQMFRIIGEIRPSRVLIENSPALRKRGLNVVLSDLAEIGYDAEWDIFTAAASGADHIRKRMFILGYTNSHSKSALPKRDEASWMQENAPHTNSSQLQGGGISSGIHPEYSYARGPSGWKDQSRLERVANGVANQMDRLRAIGNGQVPCVAARAWEALSNRIATHYKQRA